MSYCVNCGVKLRKSEKKCPLCNTIVINPNDRNIEYEPVYPNKLEKLRRVDYKYVTKLIILILLFVSLVILICDYITSKSISWSIYVLISILYLICHFQYLFQKNIYLSHIIEIIGTEFFMYIIAMLNNGIHWYLYLVLPFIMIVGLFVILCTYLVKRKKRNPLRRASVCILFASISLIAIESAIDLYLFNQIRFNWAIFASAPLIVISIILLLISFNKRLVEEIKQRIFI